MVTIHQMIPAQDIGMIEDNLKIIHF